MSNMHDARASSQSHAQAASLSRTPSLFVSHSQGVVSRPLRSKLSRPCVCPPASPDALNPCIGIPLSNALCYPGTDVKRDRGCTGLKCSVSSLNSLRQAEKGGRLAISG